MTGGGDSPAGSIRVVVTVVCADPVLLGLEIEDALSSAAQAAPTSQTLYLSVNGRP
jgi:hypothetical protein